MQNLTRFGFIAVAAFCTSLTAFAAPATGVIDLSNDGSVAFVNVPFEAQWSNVEAFMNAHVISDNAKTRADLKAETQNNRETWVCGGPELGWPTSFGSGTLIFDSPQAAAICACMIRSIEP